MGPGSDYSKSPKSPVSEIVGLTDDGLRKLKISLLSDSPDSGATVIEPKKPSQIKFSDQCKETNKMLQFLVYTTIISLSVGAPQYGGVQPSPPVKTAPLTGSVKCRTEYATLWDTEYKETETEVCTTEYEKVCRTETQRLCQPTTRQECNT